MNRPVLFVKLGAFLDIKIQLSENRSFGFRSEDSPNGRNHTCLIIG